MCVRGDIPQWDGQASSHCNFSSRIFRISEALAYKSIGRKLPESQDIDGGAVMCEFFIVIIDAWVLLLDLLRIASGVVEDEELVWHFFIFMIT